MRIIIIEYITNYQYTVIDRLNLIMDNILR